MKSLEQMIAELCPDGVEYKKLGELGYFYGGLTGKNKHDFTNGNAPFVTYMNIYSNPGLDLNIVDFVKVGEDEKQNSIEKGDILFTGSSETPDEAGMTSVVMEQPSSSVYVNSFCFGFRFHDLSNISAGFMKHLFRSRKIRKSISKTANGVTRFNISKKMLLDLEIPVPPLAVQERIVEILDKFTALTAELQAELQARQQQYEYYRNHLLSFGGLDNIRSEVANSQLITPPHWKLLKMSEIFEIRNGYTPSKNNADFWDGGTIPWFRMEDIRANGRILSDSFQHITPKAVKGKGLFEKDSFIIATTATIGEHAWLIADSLANQRFTNLKVRKSLTASLMPKFVYYYLFIVDEWCKRNVNASSFASVDMDKFKDLEFPIPPLAEQQRIVDILDRFEALTSDLQSGLPAEIAARQQQYEYYRNKLLTFKRKTA